MAEEELVFKTITPESPEKDEARRIFNEAFPERERLCPFDTMLKMSVEPGGLSMAAICTEERVIGFFAYMEKPAYVYLLYFAVSSDLRGCGYGTRVIRGILSAFREKEAVGSIETPLPGTSNELQRQKRKALYERLGLHTTKFSFGADKESMMTVVSNMPEVTNAKDAAFMADVVTTSRNFMSGPIPAGMRLFITENGETKQFTPEQLGLH